ncbi:unnamed protein product [Effrenium voratum]|uniref:Uncharacterized protein n=1 Tax=Effrenium voratum TaxID=2562239 RepID=A0AA36MQR5_9DINO|nr:unnamed protein product [Effrenium voratum]
MAHGAAAAEELFTNPIVAGNYPDPGVNKIGEYYYLVATGGGPGGAFRMLRSRDLVAWEMCGQVFDAKTLPAWSGGAHGEKCDYWAPEIHQLPDGRCAVFFSAREPQDAGLAMHVGMAFAERPEGPYVDLGRPLLQDPHWAIDASYFFDEDSGKQYVLWKIDGNAHKVQSVIKMRELEDETGASELELVRNDQKWEGAVVEGPWLVKRGGFYYLFYSGECYANHRYCVAVARAEQVCGPYVKSGAPVLSSSRGWAGPGHCVVLPAEGGDAPRAGFGPLWGDERVSQKKGNTPNGFGLFAEDERKPTGFLVCFGEDERNIKGSQAPF